MSKIYRFLCVTLYCLTFNSSAHAVTDDLPFTAEILSSCIIVIGTHGVMAPSSDYKVLDSEETGGNAGVATITAVGGTFAMSVDAPATFSAAPTGGNDNVTFAAKYGATGVTTATGIVGTTATPLNLGITVMSVDLKATKSSGVFTEGNYETATTVRCE